MTGANPEPVPLFAAAALLPPREETTSERMRRSIDSLSERAEYFAARTHDPDLPDFDDWKRAQQRQPRKVARQAQPRGGLI